MKYRGRDMDPTRLSEFGAKNMTLLAEYDVKRK